MIWTRSRSSIDVPHLQRAHASPTLFPSFTNGATIGAIPARIFHRRSMIFGRSRPPSQTGGLNTAARTGRGEIHVENLLQNSIATGGSRLPK
jgi:hypothetical protein